MITELFRLGCQKRFASLQIRIRWLALALLLCWSVGARAQSNFNCCANCSVPYPISYTNNVGGGITFLANNLCQGTNDTLNDLLPNVPDGTEVLIWNYATQAYVAAVYDSASGEWEDANTGNPVNYTLAPGEGFVVENFGTPFTLVISGCLPTCPPPCAPPPTGQVLVGRFGLGTAAYSNLFSCPPVCGTRVSIFTGSAYANFDYVNGAWTPFPPVLAPGQSAFVSVQSNSNCCPPVTNLVLNTGYNQNSNTVYGFGQADAFWWVTKDPTPATVLPRPATVIQGNPAWKPAQANSQWISSYPTEVDNLNGEYDFQTYFCTSADATNLVLNICLRADDAAGAALNGHFIPLSGSSVFNAPNPACGVVVNPSWFVVGGQNVLTIFVTNIYAVAMGVNAEVSVTGSGLLGAGSPCCQIGSGLSGQKYYDLNCNGIQDPGEPPLSGWTFHLSNGQTAVSDVNGYYYFTNLPPGTYTVSELPQSGWTNSAPAGGTYTVTLGPSQEINGQDFGNCHTNNECVGIICPSNIVVDCSGNGGAVVAFNVTAYDVCNPGAPVQVTCVPPSTSLFPVGTTTVNCTAVDGQYSWATCSFTVTVLAGSNCCPPVTNLVLNTGYNQNSKTVYGFGQADAFWWVTKDPTLPPTFLPRPATVIQGNPAWKPAQANSQWISSYPTEADNLNGEYDFQTYFCTAADATNLVLNICLRADDAAGVALNGNFIPLSGSSVFNAVNPACAVVQQAINPSYFIVGGQNVLTIYVTNIYAVAMGVNADVSVTGSGLLGTGSPCCQIGSGLSGQKYYDLNCNGVHDSDEPGLAGWTFQLSNGQTAVSDVNGYYYFTNLPPGTYTVSELPQSNWTQSAPSGGIHTVNLGPSQQINGQDFGNCHTNTNGCVVINCPSNIVVSCGGNGSIVAFNVTAYDVCNPGTPIQITCVPPSTSLFPVGTTTVHCTAMDAQYNWAKCSFTVTVLPSFSVNCSSNKTVVCGNVWSFDPPTATTCCTNNIVTSTGVTNVLITSLGIVTNGTCPKQITQTWLVSDGCGDSNLCSQTVTIVSCVPAPSGLVLWLPFDEATGNVTANLYAGGNSGVLVNGPAHNIGAYVDNSLCFSANAGVDQYVTVSDYAAIDPAVGQSFTLDAWVLRAAGAPNSPPCVVLDKRDPNSGNGYSLSVDFGHVILTLSGTSYSDATDQIPADGQWHFVAVSVAFGTSALSYFYVDGHAPVSFVPSATTLATTAPFHVAQSVLDDHGANQPWQGCIDEVEMFNRALSAAEINAIFQAGAAGKCKTPKLNCSSNKTVQCGSIWLFDPPSVNDPCCGNQPAVPYGPDTVGGTPCARTVTRAWLYVDCCGHSNFCSQTVTVVDTTPPVVHCLTNTVVVALDANCHLVIPLIKVSATDNCTPASQLHFSQSPPAGTVLGNHSQIVTVTVTDLCGNSSHCLVTVTGTDQTPPVVNCPTNLVVTNCLVPCVLPLVTATDNCCPASSLTYVQSPPCNTPLGPGINSVTVTVTDCHGNATTKSIHLSITGGTQSFVTNLFNTGVDASHVPMPDNTGDTHYLLPAGNVPVGMPADYLGNAVAVSDICHAIAGVCSWQRSPGCYVYTPWDLASPVSKWIAPNYTNNGCDPAGTYSYSLSFTLPANLTASSATISGRWAADNVAAMYVNGNLVPAVDGGFANGWSPWTTFTIPPGSGIVSGGNTLRFVVTNYSGYTGLRVEFTNAYANCFTCAPPAILSITPSQFLQEFTAANLHVNAAGTPPLSYQWYLNGTPLSNSGHDSGVNTSTIHVAPLFYSDAGVYTVIVSNPCGTATNSVRLTVTPPWWWTWGWWNVAVLNNPLSATAGPDLVLAGSSTGTNYSISSGTSEDFGLLNPGGQPVNVMRVSLPTDTAIQVPSIAPPGSNYLNSYSLILDVNLPGSNSGKTTTLFANNGTSDQLALAVNPAGFLELSGTSAGLPFDLVSSTPVQLDAWNRIALVVGNPADNGQVDNATADLYLNGQPVGSTVLPATGSPISGVSLNWSDQAPTILSRQTNDLNDVVLFASSIQLHGVALTPAQLAGIGSPGTSPAPANDTAVGPQPVLSFALSGQNVNLSWTGSPYSLQESSDLASGSWVESDSPFTESVVNGQTKTTATAKPSPDRPHRFYRLVFRP